MRGWTRILLVAGVTAAAAGACGPADHPAAPGAAPAPVMDGAPLPPPDSAASPQDAGADSTGRWGGSLGSGT